MKHTHAQLCIALMTAIAGHACGGDINPPAGPIAPTMKSLDRIEPRVCINDLPGDQGAMHVITRPGNYYLAGEIIVEAGKSGIVCALDVDSDDDNISIDMNGYSVTGLPGSLNGIWCPLVANVRVEKFNVKQEYGPTTGTRRCGGDGILIEGADDASVFGVDSENNGGAGISVKSAVKFKAGADLSKKVNIANNGGGGGGGGIIVLQCESVSLHGMNVSDNFGDGVRVTITDPDNRDESISMDELSLHGNMGDGIEIVHSSGDNARVRIRRASMDANAGDGMRVTGSGDESISYDFDELHSSHNGGYGANITALNNARISVHVTDSRFTSNVLSGLRSNGDEAGVLKGITVIGSSATRNGLHGFEVLADGGVFDRCIASENNGNGFDTTGSPDLAGVATRKGFDYYQSKADNNAASGISGDGCVLTCYVCHLISNGGNGIEINDGEARIRSSSMDGNQGSGISAIGSPIYVESSTMGQNVLYGAHYGGGGGAGGTIRVCSMKDCVIDSNGADGALVEGGGSTYVLCYSVDSIANGWGGGGGGGIIALDCASIAMTDVSATGNAGNGVTVDNSSSGIPPHAFSLEDVSACGNGAHGIFSEKITYGAMRGCVTNSNGGDGVHTGATSAGLTIDACSSSGNAANGFNVIGLDNILVNNAAAGNVAGGYKILVPGNTMGPPVDEVGAATNGNPGGNYVR